MHIFRCKYSWDAKIECRLKRSTIFKLIKIGAINFDISNLSAAHPIRYFFCRWHYVVIRIHTVSFVVINSGECVLIIIFLEHFHFGSDISLTPIQTGSIPFDRYSIFAIYLIHKTTVVRLNQTSVHWHWEITWILHEGTDKNTFLFKMVLCQLIRISNKLVGSSGLSNFTKSTVARHFSLSHSLLTGNLRATNSMGTLTNTYGEQFCRSKIHRKTWMGSCWRRCRRRWNLQLCSGNFECIHLWKLTLCFE